MAGFTGLSDTLGDSGRTSIAKAQELMKQALAELAKLKLIDTAA